MNESSNLSCDASKSSAIHPPDECGEVRRLGLFEAYGIEIENMIVDAATLDVKPVADRLLKQVAGEDAEDVVFDEMTWSNELVNHVVEIKTNGPVGGFEGLTQRFARQVDRVHRELEKLGARLMPGGMHPWMDPHEETVLWPLGSSEVYQAFHRIFDCRGHGWSNLQSAHLNLGFQGDEQFGRLHAAVRLILPLIPAIAAASPMANGKLTGEMDHRLSVYRTNCARVPQCTGCVIPEAVFTLDEYHTEILSKIYEALAPHDPDGILRQEWSNARGEIARFDRNTIEVRVIDSQECAAADVAVCAAIVSVLKRMVQERFSSWQTQKEYGTDAMVKLLNATIRDADQTVIEDEGYLTVMGWRNGPVRAGQLWNHWIETADDLEAFAPILRVITDQGPLARRIVKVTGTNPSREKLFAVYGKLSDCCRDGCLFTSA
jgi:gamma-glutamyl:cysteine ligase YbdK (ATP-grasp superfamily)